MTEPNRTRPTTPPDAGRVSPPPPFVERRRHSRRAADRIADEETRLLALSLDVLASGRPAESRLAGLLDILADTVGAQRAAVVTEGDQRRVAVAASGPDDVGAATHLATWLDAAAPRSRARRAAAAPAAVVVATGSDGSAARTLRRSGVPEPHYGWLPVPGAGDVTLGFAFARAEDAATVAERLPPRLARHAAVALALVTESMSTERELAALHAAEAERARYVSTVAHELRTPLTGLSGYLDLILDGHVDDEAIEREFLERGRSIVGSMSALVGDLLELSRLESGSLVLESAPFSVADALHTVGSGLLPIALDRGVRLVTSSPARIRTATADRRRVEQILTNLAGNALKYAADGGEVELTGRFDGQVAIIAVRDEGPGVGADDRARIFDRFYRMADHERMTGTGLGLSISRDLARAMGGDLDVASVLGVGSAFVLVLPGPSAPVDPAVITAATATAIADETERLAALGAVRAAGGASSPHTTASEPVLKVPAALR